jgi:large repetitive protein
MIQDTSGDQITVNGGSFSWSTGFAMGNIQQIVLDSGADINLQGSLNLTATGNSEALYGTGYGDTMTAQGNGDYLYAIAGNNTLIGDSGSTYMYGGTGNDLMIGGSGTNYMTMGSGADTIKIESASSSTTVNGFSAANGDKIDIADILTTYHPFEDALANFVQETTSGGNTIISVDPTGSGTFTTPLVTLSGVTGLPDLAALVSDHTLIVHHWHGA